MADSRARISAFDGIGLHNKLQRRNAMTPTGGTAIRSFHVNIPEAVLADLRQRLAQTRLPDKETVTDYSQGVPLKTVQQVLSYWQSAYDWRKVEARINAVPNFITEIDG
jgi:pimeloyl-ACP methyl ester carboxylesterase